MQREETEPKSLLSSPSSDDMKFKESVQTSLLHIGDQASNLEESLETLLRNVMPELSTHYNIFNETLIEASIYSITKIPIYGTLLGLINAESKFDALIDDFLNSLKNKLSEASSALIIKSALRLIAELVNSKVIFADSIFSLLSKFQSELSDSNNIIDDHIIYLMITLLYYCGEALYHDSSSSFETIMGFIDIYMKNRKRFKYMDLILPLKENPSDYLNLYYDGLKQLAGTNWNINQNITLKPFISFGSHLSSSKQHSIDFDIPSDISVPYLFRLPSYFFVIDDSFQLYDRMIYTELVRDTIASFCDSQEVLLNQLLLIQSPIIIIQTIIMEMLSLPHAEFPLMLYCSIVIHLFRKVPNEYPPILGPIFQYLFNSLPNMNVEARDRFALWMAYHLSSFKFKWKWLNWANALSFSNDNPQKIFLTSLLSNSVQFSYYEKVTQLLPEDYTAFIIEPRPTSPDVDEEFLSLISSHSPIPECIAALDKIPLPEDKVKLVISALLKLGIPTFSHITSIFTRYSELVKHCLSLSSNAPSIILTAIDSFWITSPRHIETICFKLYSLQLISETDIVDFIFSKPYYETYPWTILKSLMIISPSDNLVKYVFTAFVNRLNMNYDNETFSRFVNFTRRYSKDLLTPLEDLLSSLDVNIKEQIFSILRYDLLINK